jgi:hypothetical protein
MVKAKNGGMAQILYFRLKSASARPTLCTVCTHQWTAMLKLSEDIAKCPQCGKYNKAGNYVRNQKCKTK